MANKKYKKKSLRKKMVALADKALSLYIRKKTQETYGACPMCGGEIECCFHWITRSKYSVRWDLENVIGSCMGCNIDYEYNPHPYISWFIRKYGLDKYEQLIVKSNKIHKYELSDLQDIIDVYSREK